MLGATGRMGQAILRCVGEASDLSLSGAVTEVGDPALGTDAGDHAGIDALGVPLTDDRAQALHGAQVAIDFGGRPWLVWEATFRREKVGDMPTEMFLHFFKSFS